MDPSNSGHQSNHMTRLINFISQNWFVLTRTFLQAFSSVVFVVLLSSLLISSAVVGAWAVFNLCLTLILSRVVLMYMNYTERKNQFNMIRSMMDQVSAFGESLKQAEVVN